MFLLLRSALNGSHLCTSVLAKLEGELMYDSKYRADKSCVVSIQRIPCKDRERWQHSGVDYDTNILGYKDKII